MTDEERREKMRQYHREWRQRNPEKVKAAQRKYYDAHSEERRLNTARWRERNPERVKEYRQLSYPKFKEWRKGWLRNNRERHADQVRRSRARHPQKLKEYARAYRKRRPDVMQALTQRRRARERNAPGSFTAAQWKALCLEYGHRCLCCGRLEPEIRLVPDHVKPLARGGSNYIDNIQPLCVSCNARKNTREVDYRPESRERQLTLW